MVEGGGKTGSLTGHDQEDVPEKEMGEVVPKRKRPDLSLQPVAVLLWDWMDDCNGLSESDSSVVGTSVG